MSLKEQTGKVSAQKGSSRRNIFLGIGVVGLSVAATAYILRAEPAKLHLDGYRLTFAEDFDAPNLSIEELMTRWYPHTPWNGDFGDAAFADPKPGFPFQIENGALRIEARKDAQGKWQSGLIASQNPKGEGFAQQYGYFEMRAKMPPGPGVWPAFWLDSMVPASVPDPSIEIDVVEYYGQFTSHYNSTVIIWPKGGAKNRAVSKTMTVESGTLSSDYHTYGVSVEPDWIVMFLDGVEMWRTKTPPEHKHKLMVLANLALGSGWPIDKTPNPSYMYIDYIRVYTKR